MPDTIRLPHEGLHDGRALRAILAGHWAISEDGLRQMIAIAGRFHEAAGDEHAIQRIAGQRVARGVSVRDGVGVVSVHGPIFRHADLFAMLSGASSFESIAASLGELDADPAIRAIVLDIASPGGMVEGTSETAQLVRALDTPTTAFVSGDAASAAYWLASAAPRIVVADTAKLGSIGVLGTYRLRDDDTEIEIVSSQSPRKVPDPRTDEGRADLQATVDALADVFVDSVAENRGVDRATVLEDFGAGGVLVGADAVDAEMADELGTLEAVIADAASRQGALFPTRSPMREPTMPNEITRAALEAQAPELVTEIRAEGATAALAEAARDHAAALDTACAEARAEGAATERERIRSILALDMPGHADLLRERAFDGESQPGDVAQAIILAEGAARRTELDRARDEAAAARVPAAAAAERPEDDAAGTGAELSIDEQIKATWDSSPELRAEHFNKFERFAALERGRLEGRIRLAS